MTLRVRPVCPEVSRDVRFVALHASFDLEPSAGDAPATPPADLKITGR